jgi:hypothetical protein
MPSRRKFSLLNSHRVNFMSDPPIMREPAQRGSNQDRQIAVGILAISLLLIVGLWAVSRNAPSSVQQDSVALITADVSGEEGCQNFGEFWTTGTGVHVPTDAIAAISNCRQSAEGTWFVPTGSDDPRLQSGSILTVDQATTTEPLAIALEDDLTALENALPDSLKESLSANFDDVNQPVFGHTKRGRTDLTVKRNRYARITQAFLISPEHTAVSDYVGWITQRRVEAANAFENACRSDPDLGFIVRACIGVRNEFTVSQIPLYWELNDPVLIQEYLIARSSDPIALPGPTVESTT